jgi:tyrosinase
MTVAETLDTADAPLHYRYAGMAAAPAVREVVGFRAAGPAGPEESMEEGPPPELVGATASAQPLGGSPSVVVVSLREPAGPVAKGLAQDAREPRVHLGIEHVTGTDLVAPTYLVHVNLPSGADPDERDDLLAGSLPMFGVREASAAGSEHGRGGLSFTFDITGVVARLRQQGAWDPQRVEVTFTPVWGSEDAEGGNVSVGRISVYYE